MGTAENNKKARKRKFFLPVLIILGIVLFRITVPALAAESYTPTITAWSWVDASGIVSPDSVNAVIPGVSGENPIDWDTLTALLPQGVTVMADGETAALSVTWECDAFPAGSVTGGQFTCRAVLPGSFALAEGVPALELKVDLGQAAVYAASMKGDGSPGNPYQICNSDDLHQFAWYVNNNGASSDPSKQRQTGACAVLMNDITYNYNGSSNWYVIGSKEHPYTGTFNGNNHTISGLSLTDTNGFNGFIRVLGAGGSVTNLNISAAFSGSSNSGGIVGRSFGTVSNCSFSGSISCSGSSNIGGIVGDNQGTVSNCRSSAAVTGGSNVGGIAGSNRNTVERCSNSGTVSGNQYVGGVVGLNGTWDNPSASSLTRYCYNTGNVNGTKYVGGVTGMNRSAVESCYNAGSVTGSGHTGSVIGTNVGTAKRCYSDNTVCDKNTIGVDSGTKENVGKYQTTAFSSGQICYLLNGETSEGSLIWYQTLGTDTYPRFSGKVVSYDSSLTPNYFNGYAVTVSSGSGGSVAVSRRFAPAGAQITLTVAPAPGYSLQTLTVQDASGQPVTVTGSSFTMPASDVTVTAVFGAAVIPVDSITLPANTALSVGQSTELTATVFPADATSKALQWVSSDPGVLKLGSSTGNPVTVEALSPGSVTVTATALDGSGTSASCSVTVSYLPSPGLSDFQIQGAAYQSPGGAYWLKEDAFATVIPPADFTISTGQDGTYGESTDIPEPTGSGITVYLKRQDGARTDGISLDDLLKWDTTPPTGTITLVDTAGTWNTLTDSLSTLYTRKNEIRIDAADADSGIHAIAYSVQPGPAVDCAAISSWEEYNGTFPLTENTRSVVYVRLTDNVGNAAFFNTDILFVDTLAPVISGIGDGRTYYTTQKVMASDNGELDALTGTGSDNTIPGNPAQPTEHVITATDKAGNSARVTITMKPISSLSEGLPTEDTLQLTDLAAIEAVEQAVGEEPTAHATAAETARLEEILDRCGLLLSRIQQANTILDLIRAMPDPSGTEPDDEPAIAAYEAAAAAWGDPDLPASVRRMVGAENEEKLAAMLDALTDYDIIRQSARSYVKGSGKKLTFTVNGHHSKFAGIEIDGKAVDGAYYDTAPGSTIITLHSRYLKTLSAGKHTIRVLYTDGSTDGTDSFRIAVNNGSPFTGDDSHMLLFGIGLPASLACMAMLVILRPRKQGKYRK